MMIDYSKSVTVPVRDFSKEDTPVAFLVTVYGVTPKDLLVSPGGGYPMKKAVERLGLDPTWFKATIWEVPVEAERERKYDFSETEARPEDQPRQQQLPVLVRRKRGRRSSTLFSDLG